MNLTTLELTGIKDRFRKRASAVQRRVIVCAGTGCLVNGSMKVYDRFIESVGASRSQRHRRAEKGRGWRLCIEERLSGFLPDRPARHDTP